MNCVQLYTLLGSVPRQHSSPMPDARKCAHTHTPTHTHACHCHVWLAFLVYFQSLTAPVLSFYRKHQGTTRPLLWRFSRNVSKFSESTKVIIILHLSKHCHTATRCKTVICPVRLKLGPPELTCQCPGNWPSASMVALLNTQQDSAPPAHLFSTLPSLKGILILFLLHHHP